MQNYGVNSYMVRRGIESERLSLKLEQLQALQRAQAVPASLSVEPVAIQPVLRGRVRHDQIEAVAVSICQASPRV